MRFTQNGHTALDILDCLPEPVAIPGPVGEDTSFRGRMQEWLTYYETQAAALNRCLDELKRRQRLYMKLAQVLRAELDDQVRSGLDDQVNRELVPALRAEQPHHDGKYTQAICQACGATIRRAKSGPKQRYCARADNPSCYRVRDNARHKATYHLKRAVVTSHG